METERGPSLKVKKIRTPECPRSHETNNCLLCMPGSKRGLRVHLLTQDPSGTQRFFGLPRKRCSREVLPSEETGSDLSKFMQGFRASLFKKKPNLRLHCKARISSREKGKGYVGPTPFVSSFQTQAHRGNVSQKEVCSFRLPALLRG